MGRRQVGGAARWLRRRAAHTGCRVLAVLVLFVVRVPNALGTAGALDPSFGSGGYATVSVGAWAGVSAVVVQPDGRIVTAGEASVAGRDVILAMRMTPSGSLDPTFGNGGVTTVDINGDSGVDSGSALALQPDGKIVIAG